jgi:8-oxo-dGTP diphosphatase
MEYKDSTGKIWVPTTNDTIQWRMTAYAVIMKDSKVLTIKGDRATLFGLPGGGVEKAESITEGLKRQCKEEIGFDIEFDAGKPFCITESKFYLWGVYYHSVNMIYQASIVGGSAEDAHPNEGEVEKIEWKNISDCTKETIYEHVYPVFTELQRLNSL